MQGQEVLQLRFRPGIPLGLRPPSITPGVSSPVSGSTFTWRVDHIFLDNRSLAKRLEIHYTPKHGSWLNIAELELSVMTRQCLSRRISSITSLQAELSEWVIERNQNQKGVDWQFTTDDARIKIKRLYSQFKS